MLTLKNIKIKNNVISASYIPESSNEIGFIKYDYINDLVLEKETTALDSELEMYFHHTKKRLKRYIENNETRSEITVMWY